MSCRKAKRLLSPYIDGACSAGQRLQVEQHLDGCPDCSALLGELRRTGELVSALPEKRTPDEFMATLTPKLRELAQAPEPGPLRRALQWMLDAQARWQTATAGALVLVMAVTVFGVLNRGGEPPAPTQATTEIAEDDYLSNAVEHHRRFAATNLPFDDQAYIYAGYPSGL